MMSRSNNTLWKARQPADTHFRPATCAESACPHHLLGWQTLIDESGQFGQAQAAYIRRESGRQFREERMATGLTAFTFGPGQKCFRQHRLPLERPAVFSKDGRVLEGQDWVDDMREDLFKIKRLHGEG